MNELSARCLGIEEDEPCTDVATITRPVPLCTHHQMQVAVAIVPDMLASVLTMPKRSAVPEARDANTVRLVHKAKTVVMDLSGGHGERVYVLRNGDRVKIGYTTNLRSRLGSLCLQPESVLVLFQGGKDLEAALHRYFSAHRVSTTEWFRFSDEIKTYLSQKIEGRPSTSKSATLSEAIELPAELREGPLAIARWASGRNPKVHWVSTGSAPCRDRGCASQRGRSYAHDDYRPAAGLRGASNPHPRQGEVWQPGLRRCPSG